MPPAIPRATYRLQLTARFTFDDAAAAVPYLATLGISHVYASPFLRARAGSTHGYDVIDYGSLNPELGGDAGFARLSAALERAQLGLVLDFVPNHMAVNGADNHWWLDVLEWGRASPHAASFDIDWKRLRDRPRGAVLLPLLGRPYHEALAAGEIELRFDPSEGCFSAWYFEHRLPIAPQCYAGILRRLFARSAPFDESVGKQIRTLAARKIASRSDADALKHALANNACVRDFIARGLSIYRPDAGNPHSGIALHRLLERQHYRLAHWRLASSEINYRRFFDINSLAALRVENPSTFAAAHGLALGLVKRNQLHGLRLDHIDGLWDPHAYCGQLQQAIRDLRSEGSAAFYTIVEKILEPDEPQPAFPGSAGTTGYEGLNLITRVLADGAGMTGLTRAWIDFSGEARPFSQILRAAKRFVLANILASEFAALVDLLARIATGHCSTREFAPPRLRAALELFVLCFPIYRTYVTPARSSASDRHFIEQTIAAARREWQGPEDGIFDFLQALLTLDLIASGRRTHSCRRARQFVGKLQQFTGPMMAKSMEDTAFYRYHALLALTEVGGRPDASNMSVQGFHERMRRRANDVPH
ncbi:MAG: malto-oligosyltrehalose synthase, partial [Proteobacteria bacterium]